MLATTGVILSAAYALWLYRRVIFGTLTKSDLKLLTDMTPRERLIFAPLVVMTLVMGVWPAPFLNVMDASVSALIKHHQAALAAGRALASLTP